MKLNGKIDYINIGLANRRMPYFIFTGAFTKIFESQVFKSATPPYNKILSCSWERVWSIIFKQNNLDIKHIDTKQITKTWGARI